MNREESLPDLAMLADYQEGNRRNLEGDARLRKCRDLVIASLVYSAVSILLFVGLSIHRSQWQLLVLAGGNLLAFCSFLVCFNLIGRKRLEPAMWWLVGAGEFSFILSGLFIQRIGPFLGLSAILLAIIEIAAVLERGQTIRFAVLGVISSFLAVFVNIVNPASLESMRLDIPFIYLGYELVLVILAALFVVLFLRRYLSLSIQTKLLTGYLVAALAPLLLTVALNNNLARLSIIIIDVMGLLGGLLAIVLAEFLSRPIVHLTEVARVISSGDLHPQVNVRTRDEIETLSKAFVHMTDHIRYSISGLEESVQKRTQELTLRTQHLTYRSAQLQTLADVARAIASIQDLETLLHQVAGLTSERFNFYHVGIFLLDEAGEYAVLRATNSEGGQRMLTRQYRLKAAHSNPGQEPGGMVGYVAASGQPRIATDVGRDAIFFDNPDLPLTRSEMALPLKSGEKVIGVLDIQSVVANAFTEEDVSLFSILSDQIAIAIINNRLYAETRQALNETQNLHRAYLRKEWQQEARKHRYLGYRYTQQGLLPIEALSTLEIEKALQTGEISVNTVHADPRIPGATRLTALAVPIKLRGETIGVIDLQEIESDRQWSPEEIAMAQSVADQIGVALENARLFEQTVRRADRERKVLEITGKIRSTNDPQAMLQTAITELQQALKASKAQVLFEVRPGNIDNQNGKSASGSRAGLSTPFDESLNRLGKPGGIISTEDNGSSGNGHK